MKDNIDMYDKTQVVNEFNIYFIKVGPNLAAKI